MRLPHRSAYVRHVESTIMSHNTCPIFEEKCNIFERKLESIIVLQEL